MSELTVGWFNAANAFDPQNPEVQERALKFIGSLPMKLDVVGIGEFTKPGIADADIVALGERFCDMGYRSAAISDYTRQHQERNASTMALLVGQHLESHAQVQKSEFGVRLGFIATTPSGIEVAVLHPDDGQEEKRIGSIRDVLGKLAMRAGSDAAPQEAGEEITRSVAVADFNALSLKDNRIQTRILRWLGAHTPMGKFNLDFYGRNPLTRGLGFLVRSIRMADGRSRELLEATGMHNANIGYAPTCFHGPKGAFRLSIDDIYASGDGKIEDFVQFAPCSADGKRLSDHNFLVAKISFPD